MCSGLCSFDQISFKSFIRTISFPCVDIALIAGVGAFLLVVVLLLVLVVGVLAVMMVRKKRKRMEAVQSLSKVGSNPQAGEVAGESINTDYMVHYENSQMATAGLHIEAEYTYATADDAFINPASATASHLTHVSESAYYSEVDQRPLEINAGEGGLYEEARGEVRWSGGGLYEEAEKHAAGKQKKSAATEQSSKLQNPEDLYTQPNMMKKTAKPAKQINRTDDTDVNLDDLYAQPDMTKKKNKRSQQQWEQESEGKKSVPPAPRSYNEHKADKNKRKMDEEDSPEIPPPYVSYENLN